MAGAAARAARAVRSAGAHGQKICALAVCYSGERACAHEALAPLRALAAPPFDLRAERPYVEVQSYLGVTDHRLPSLLEDGIPAAI